MPESDNPLTSIATFLSEMNEASLGELEHHYSSDIHFTDPINDAHGLAHLKAVFEDLFKQLKNVRLKPIEIFGSESKGILFWEMRYTFRGKERTLHGTSVFEFDEEGKATRQWDQWDAGIGVYAEFPVLGAMIRGIRKMIQVKAPGA